MGYAMTPAYGGYPMMNSSVVPMGQAPMATPMMVMPGYAPTCVPVYTTANPAVPGAIPQQVNQPTVARPKPLSEEVNMTVWETFVF